MLTPENPLQPLARNNMNIEEVCTNSNPQSIIIMSSVPTQVSPTNAFHCENQAMETENIPKTKKVRFTGVPETDSSKPACAVSKQEMDLEKLMERVQQRAARRRHNRHKRIGSPPPPGLAADFLFSNVNDAAVGSKDNDDTKIQAKMKLLQRHVKHLEKEIQTAARMELALLNQSKALRDQRQKMTKRFELMYKKMSILQQRGNSNNNQSIMPVATVEYNLPPLFNTSATRRPRRVSATEADKAACATVLIDLSECA